MYYHQTRIQRRFLRLASCRGSSTHWLLRGNDRPGQIPQLLSDPREVCLCPQSKDSPAIPNYQCKQLQLEVYETAGLTVIFLDQCEIHVLHNLYCTNLDQYKYGLEPISCSSTTRASCPLASSPKKNATEFVWWFWCFVFVCVVVCFIRVFLFLCVVLLCFVLMDQRL